MARNAALAVNRRNGAPTPVTPMAVKSGRRLTLTAEHFPHDKMKEDLGDECDFRSKRVAYFLDWAAKNMPSVYINYSEVVRAIDNRKSLPRLDSADVKALRSSIANVRGLLRERYGRELDTAPNSVRATTGDEDAATVVLPKKLRRLRSAKNAVIATHSLIDPANVKDARIRAYLENDVNAIIKAIGSESFDKRLLPPSADAEGAE
jgi:hypothetical protein